MEDEQQITPSLETDYIAAINELKKNTVPAADYDKLRAENKKLLQSLIQGVAVEAPAEAPADIQELRNTLFGGERELSNLEYAENMLKLRTALIEGGAGDPFLPVGRNIFATDEDKAAAERVSAALAHCIEVADGDNAIFTNELQRIMIDSNPTKKGVK